MFGHFGFFLLFCNSELIYSLQVDNLKKNRLLHTTFTHTTKHYGTHF